MKNIIIGVLIFLGIFSVLFLISDWIGRGNIYIDKEKQQRIEYCINQQKSFEDCWLSVYRPFDYQKKQ